MSVVLMMGVTMQSATAQLDKLDQLTQRLNFLNQVGKCNLTDRA